VKAFTSETRVYDGVLAGGALDRCSPADRHHHLLRHPGHRHHPVHRHHPDVATTPEIADQGRRPMIAQVVMGLSP